MASASPQVSRPRPCAEVLLVSVAASASGTGFSAALDLKGQSEGLPQPWAHQTWWVPCRRLATLDGRGRSLAGPHPPSLCESVELRAAACLDTCGRSGCLHALSVFTPFLSPLVFVSWSQAVCLYEAGLLASCPHSFMINQERIALLLQLKSPERGSDWSDWVTCLTLDQSL